MLKREFAFAVSLFAVMSVGNAYATTPSGTEAVSEAHTVYTAASNAGASGAATNIASGIAGVTYVNRMVNLAGNAAQKAEDHAAAAGASAIVAKQAADDAATEAAKVANKFNKTSSVKNAIVTTDSNGNVAPVAIVDEETGTYVTDVAVSGGKVTLTRGTPASYSLPTASSSTKGGVKIGTNVNVATDGTISVNTTATPTKDSAVPLTSGGAFTALATKEAVANKVTSISSTSTDTQYPSAKAVYTELAKKQNTLTIDAALSATSTNPVQNKVVNTALAGKQATIDDLATIRTGAAEGATAVQLSEVETGNANGTISVQGTDVAVKGLGSAAYTASTAYATAAQGVLATNAVPQSLVKSDFANASNADKDSATAIPTTGFAQDMIDATVKNANDQINTINSRLTTVQNTAVTHKASTAVGTTGKPVYIASNGAATEVTSIDSSLLPVASSTIAGLAKWGQIPSGGAEATTYATIWVE